MFTEITDTKDLWEGVILYDGACAICSRGAHRFERLLNRRGFRLMPLQSPQAADLADVTREQLLSEMHLVTPPGNLLRGVDALLFVAARIWWARPICWIARMPGVTPLARRAYRHIARNRYRINRGACALGSRHGFAAILSRWLAPMLLVTVAGTFGARLPAWAYMWVLALAMYGASKWITWQPYAAGRGTVRGLAYLFAWPGMDPKEFSEGRVSVSPTAADYLPAIVKTFVGAALMWLAARRLMAINTVGAGWVGMLGLTLLLHFGLLHLIALMWQSAGFHATPLMNRPLNSRSLGELWGRRWNTGFSALANQLIFRPLVAWIGPTAAMGCVFFFSGLIHDAVISLPARGGFGRPTLYFMLQFAGLLVQRSRIATRLGLRSGARGRLFTLVIALAPVSLLFHAPFIHRVIIPFLAAIGAI